MSDQTDTDTGLDPEQAAEWVSGRNAQLIDVRQDHEWEAGRIDGAVHIPLEQLPARTSELDRERPLIFQCRSGARSAMATAAFLEAGFDAHNLEGGLESWVERGLPIEPTDGVVAKPRPDNS